MSRYTSAVHPFRLCSANVICIEVASCSLFSGRLCKRLRTQRPRPRSKCCRSKRASPEEKGKFQTKTGSSSSATAIKAHSSTRGTIVWVNCATNNALHSTLQDGTSCRSDACDQACLRQRPLRTAKPRGNGGDEGVDQTKEIGPLARVGSIPRGCRQA